MLADESCQGLSPDGWSRRVAAAVARWDADMVVAEANNGGAMVESVLKGADVGGAREAGPCVARKGGEGGAGRAPVRERTSLLRRKLPAAGGRAFGADDGWPLRGASRSPDRADAMVWAMTELSESRSGIPRVRML